MYYLCVTPDRELKTRMMMDALSVGFNNIPHRIVLGKPPENMFPFVVWGQEWTALEIIPEAIKVGRGFWHLDNGYWNPARGGVRGYYRMTYRSMTPVLLNMDKSKLRVPTATLQQWRKNGRHVLLAMPGVHFGMALGIDVRSWCDKIVDEVRSICKEIDRPLVIRNRDEKVRNLRDDLSNAWAVVTHSSNVAVDAVISGIPVFVQSTSAAAPVGRLDLDLANPITPGRDQWLRSLASQHFTINEMKNGTAQFWMKKIEEIVDQSKEPSHGRNDSSQIVEEVV